VQLSSTFRAGSPFALFIKRYSSLAVELVEPSLATRCCAESADELGKRSCDQEGIKTKRNVVRQNLTESSVCVRTRSSWHLFGLMLRRSPVGERVELSHCRHQRRSESLEIVTPLLCIWRWCCRSECGEQQEIAMGRTRPRAQRRYNSCAWSRNNHKQIHLVAVGASQIEQNVLLCRPS
jgi:hypothetical protein